MAKITFPILCLMLYMEMARHKNSGKERPTVQRPQGANDAENEILLKRQKEESPYEESVRLDLQKQEPGLGDNGRAIFLHDIAYHRGNEIYQKTAVNEEASERLPYNRTLVDSRHPACLELDYDVDTLPTASVIIVFFNEPYSVLVRTVHSTLRTCVATILKQIILVDDGSTNMELGGKLDYYIRSRLPAAKVQVVRQHNRLGLIRARLAGARIATGDVLIFLDAHCEANAGWCEPLVQRIKDSRSSVLVPIIDSIDAKDFEYRIIHHNLQLGGFQWNGHFDWMDVPIREKHRQLQECRHTREICPAQSPTMAGGLFAIDRSYFWEMGSYDEQMDGWGGENLEMSFRIWQCGGTIEVIPCSRVGHIFHDFYPHSDDRDTHGINAARLALVWMDEYVNIFFLYRPELKSHPHIGNVTDRISLRKQLGCKSFDWYLKNVYPEKFLPTKDVISYGRIKAKNSNLCLDDMLREKTKPFNMGLIPCLQHRAKAQLFSYTKNRVLRNEFSCATVQLKPHPPYFFVMVKCMETDNRNHHEKWTYVNQQFMHVASGLCLDHKGLRSMDDVRVDVCDSGSETQRWVIIHDDDE